MKLLGPKEVSILQKKTSSIRNVCIMAHVDHGKTTLADYLLASNGVISQRLAGQLRYMDSRKDEQERGITMKSSCITLFHNNGDRGYLINLIDSPGHVDFSLEVSTAVRLCDGCIILVDVVEGVCPQTQLALKHAWLEKIKPVLVLNKMDRLLSETKLSPLDAYVHLTQVLEQVNAIMGDLFKSEVLTQSETNENQEGDYSTGLEEADDSNLYFSPTRGNVVFASATEGWGFCIADFAEIFSSKLGFNRDVLLKTLWGDFYYDSKSKRVKKGAQAKAKKPLFAQLILENLWKFYDCIANRTDKDKMRQCAEYFDLKLTNYDLRTTDTKHLLRTVFSQWLPLASCVLNMVCDQCPPPNQLSEEKIDSLMYASNKSFYTLPPETIALKSAFFACSQDKEVPVIVLVSKMFPVDNENLPENKNEMMSVEEVNKIRALAKSAAENDANISELPREDKNEYNIENDETPNHSLIAFARIYSGCIRTGQRLYVLGPKHDPVTAIRNLQNGVKISSDKKLIDLKEGEHVTEVVIDKLYMLMGRELEYLDEVPAGNVFGIGGLEDHILKSATLSSELACPPFAESQHLATPILRVAVEPENPSQLNALVRGLKLLNQADACVQVIHQETGEYVLVTAGEVHLQRCLTDLTERYAKIPVLASEPIIPFRETIVPAPKVDMVNELIQDRSCQESRISEVNRSIIRINTTNKGCSISIAAIPLPPHVTEILENNVELLKVLSKFASLDGTVTTNEMDICSKIRDALYLNDGENLQWDENDATLSNKKILSDRTSAAIAALKFKLAGSFQEAGEPWNNINVDDIWCFGPRHCGPNILVNKISSYGGRNIWARPQRDASNPFLKYDGSFLTGFQLATLSGPLCAEPLMGVGFVVHEWEIDPSQVLSSGQVITAVKEGCRKAFQVQPQRLMTAMYTCNIQANTEVLGKMYGVLNRRHGRILQGDMTPGSTAHFQVTAVLPVAESSNFAAEIRKQTSGLASPQLVFSHWEVIDVDPYWKPNTEEEYLHYGEKADSANYARICMNSVRRRKGLAVDEKIIEFGEKQRTLSKKK